jgi:diketogulonate reductase-like aldo/keto reductase
MAHDMVVIPKSVTPTRIKENIGAIDFELSVEDVKSIDTLNQDYRYIIPSSWGIPYFK